MSLGQVSRRGTVFVSMQREVRVYRCTSNPAVKRRAEAVEGSWSSCQSNSLSPLVKKLIVARIEASCV